MLEKVFDSEDLPVTDRVDAWQDIVAQSLVPNAMSIDRDGDFHASLRAVDLGACQVTAVSYSSLRTLRTAKMIRRSDPEMYVMALVLRGRQVINQADRVTATGANDLVTYSTFMPYDVQVDAGGHTAATLLAQIPRQLLPLPSHKVDRLLATRLPGREGVNVLLTQFLTHLATGLTPQRPTDGPRLGLVLLDLFTAILAHHLDDSLVPPESCQRTLFLQIQAFIHHHLGDPNLSPAAIAAAHHISTRHLQRLFQSHGDTVAAWIRHQRLERVRRDLTDPALKHQPIHAIAARWGLIVQAHFSRIFSTAYGLSPSDFRQQAHDRDGRWKQGEDPTPPTRTNARK
ncbi:helix-turn-helix domain-containing protein [Streptomyces sp. NPDC020965]|uniref:AraC-like ligand-binding domain-containing protein n=1 Tax=Streptomyces sp. NPDC020965 TaxID=3365105 RepID=UPI0037A20FF8